MEKQRRTVLERHGGCSFMSCFEMCRIVKVWGGKKVRLYTESRDV